jgi:hypothetical protein
VRIVIDLESPPSGPPTSGPLRGTLRDPNHPDHERTFFGTLELLAELEAALAADQTKEPTVAYKFFDDDGLNFEVQNLLGQLHAGTGDAGEILATVGRISDGDDASWVREWEATADRVAQIADECAKDGHDVSARDTYLRAAQYYATALTSIDGLPDADVALKRVFAAHRHCYAEYAARLDRPAEPVQIPYEGTTMPGYFFSAGDGRRPTLILNNGSDGPITWVFPGVGAAAVARGYNVLVFDGPGQQSMLFERGIPFRYDWEKVITPVVDFLVARPDVDPARVALYGCSQAGYWVPRALAFEHRIAAAIADPGVVDVSTSWLERVPAELVTMLDNDDRESFEQFMTIGLADATPQVKQELAWRAKPYGLTSAYDTFKAVREYQLKDVAHQITTPLLITDPEGEQFWPGQSEQLYNLLPGPKELVQFTAAEGADRHCQPMGRALTDQRMFDWLDSIIAASGTPA